MRFKNHHIFIFGFQCVAISIEGWLAKEWYSLSDLAKYFLG